VTNIYTYIPCSARSSLYMLANNLFVCANDDELMMHDIV